MTAPSMLPRRIFQTIALTSLAAIWIGAGELGARHIAPVGPILDVLGPLFGGLVVWILATLAWALLMLPLRPMARFPSFAETMRAEGIESPADLQRRVGERRMALRAMEHGTPEERRGYHLAMSAGGAAVSVIAGVATGANLAVAPETLFLTPPVVLVVAVVLVLYHLVRAASAR